MDFDRYDTISKWPILPQPPGDWKVLEKSEIKALLGAEIGKDTHFVLCARAMPLPFYADHFGLEILLDLGEDNNLGLLCCMIGEEITILKGTSSEIHELNDNLPITLTNADIAKSYLQFFCYHVRGEEGSFLIIENTNELLWNKSVAADKCRKATQKAIIPLAQEDAPEDAQDSDGYYFVATVRYANHLFKGDFWVQPTGMVEMLQDDPLDLGHTEGELPFELECFDGPLRLLSKKK